MKILYPEQYAETAFQVDYEGAATKRCALIDV